MMRCGRRALACLAGVLIAGAACASQRPVAVERSNGIEGALTPDAEPGLPDVGAERPTAPDDDRLPPVVEAPETTVSWGDCAPFGIPGEDALGTRGWECATLSAPMDPFGDDDAGSVELALTRHRATGERRGAILVNPGGPGGDGLSTAWAIRNELSAELLRGFDLVSWDPRGIGQSTPKIACDDDVSAGAPEFIGRCVELTGPLSAYLAAPYSAADMEAIRQALGEEQLNFLGYSYGSLLGATYAAAHPERVGAFVLDGVTDPRVGATDGPSNDGFPSLADDGFDQALDRFVELCDATDRCLFSLDAATVVDELAIQVPALGTPDFDGPPERVDAASYDEVIDTALAFAGDWELVATALSDADRGDASSLASLVAGPDDADPADDGRPGESDFAAANFMIYCADLGPLLTDQSFCDAMPTNAERVGPVDAVDLDRDVLVIGTEFDPLTPGYHAPEFAAALGDATHIIWEGVGHTAFPGWTPCIDAAVDAQFLRQPLPEDGTRCSFLFGVDDDTELGDELFGHGDVESDRLLQLVLRERYGERVACVAGRLNQEPDRVISHVILDVTSDEATEALGRATAAC